MDEDEVKKETGEKINPKKSKIHNISLIFTIVFIVVTFLIIIFVTSSSPEKSFVECNKESDCVKVQTTCCPCEMGGIERCVPYGQQDLYRAKDCPEKPVCIALYNCEVKECICSEGDCKEIIGEKTGE